MVKREIIHSSRIAVRLPPEERALVQALINSGRFLNMSAVVRAALEEFLKET